MQKYALSTEIWGNSAYFYLTTIFMCAYYKRREVILVLQI